jgi:hypothetical protein
MIMPWILIERGIKQRRKCTCSQKFNPKNVGRAYGFKCTKKYRLKQYLSSMGRAAKDLYKMKKAHLDMGKKIFSPAQILVF